MTVHRAAACAIGLALLMTGLDARAQDCPPATGARITELDQAVCDVLVLVDENGFAAGELGGLYQALFTAALIAELEEASSRAELDAAIEQLTEVELLAGESARTDKQLGGGGGATGSTSLVESPGLEALLGLAVERGAVTKKQVGTAMHFGTSPYAVSALLNGDTAKNYEKYEALTQFGFGMVVPISGGADDTGNGPDFSEISEVSFQWRILGNRSTRSEKFQKAWRNEFGPQLRAVLAEESALMRDVFGNTDRGVRTRIRNTLRDDIQAVVDTAESPIDAAAVRAQLGPIVSTRARQLVRQGLDSGEIRVGLPDLQNQIDALEVAYENLEGKDGKTYEESYKGLLESEIPHILTLDYAFHPVQDGGSDFSDAKLLYLYTLRGDRASVDLTVNASGSFNHSPKDSMNQDAIRSYAGSLALSHDFTADFLPKFGSQDMTLAKFSLSGRVERSEDRDATIGSGQAKLDLPFAVGFVTPITVTYSSRTLERSKDEWRVNFGVQLDTDKIFSWTRARDLLAGFGS